MSNTIAVAQGEYGETRLIEAPDETDNQYRLDVGGIQVLFDTVEMSQSRKEFDFFRGDDRVNHIEANVLPDKVQGALGVLSRNQNN